MAQPASQLWGRRTDDDDDDDDAASSIVRRSLHLGTYAMLKHAVTAAMPLLLLASSPASSNAGRVGPGDGHGQPVPVCPGCYPVVLEFGVASGRSIRMLHSLVAGTEASVHGFDTFEGLPEAWGSEDKGTYTQKGRIPKNLPSRGLDLHVGLFDDTLPSFLADQPEGMVVSLVNVDCDLYSSTVSVLSQLTPYVVPGTVFVFDEFVCHETWRTDEALAWLEWCHDQGWLFETLAVSMVSKQAVMRITEKVDLAEGSRRPNDAIPDHLAWATRVDDLYC
uniref:Uncharacterized protein n=1 Tax=Octactis speculum TaxID=3111310 RepID=A0A7S2BNQ4_9STRA|mmetsp:Transcript_25328/g.34794  ORF Transcript_25328/g.34794 Transcript_25328/m.34794 type:complete len:278 (+) Transcript_25328:832-1665(+)